MKKGLKIALIAIVILALIGLAYYFLIAKGTAKKYTIGSNGNGTPSVPPIKVGDDAYLNAAVGYYAGNGSGIPVYNKSVAAPAGNFLEGTTRADWYSGPIGKVVEIKPGWIKVTVNDLQIWKFIFGTGYTTNIAKLTGDYWFSDKAIITY